MANSFWKEIKDLTLRKKFSWSILVVISAALFYTIQTQSPHWVEKIFAQGNLYFLNLITDTRVNQGFYYYLGRSQETLWGPLSQLISGGLFAALAVRFLKDVKTSGFTLAVFLYLVLTKIEVLSFPPYGDAIGGPFAEAIWLAKHNFDYVGLFHEPSYLVGGPRVYLFSIFPTFLAVGLKWISSTGMFLAVYHLFIFGMSSLIVAQLKEVTQKVFSHSVATLLALVLLYMPLFQSQTEAINMEIPCLFFVMMSAAYLVRKQLSAASFAAMMAAFAKGTGILACWAVGLISFIFLFFRKGWKKKIRYLLWSLGLVLFSLFTVSLKYVVHDHHVSQGMLKPLIGWQSVKFMPTFYLLIFCFVAFIIFWGWKVFVRRSVLAMEEKKHFYLSFVMFVFAAMWFLLFLNFFAVSYRYRLIAFPFLLFCFLDAAAIVLRPEILKRGVLILCVVYALINSYGYCYGTFPQNDHVMLERSLEYRSDLKLNQRLVALMDSKYKNALIGAPFTVAQMLALPELGYSSGLLEIMIYGYPCTYGGILNYPGKINLPLHRTVFVGVNDFLSSVLGGSLPYPMGPQDRITDELEYGNKKIWVFVGGASIEQFWRAQFFIANPQILKRLSL